MSLKRDGFGRLVVLAFPGHQMRRRAERPVAKGEHQIAASQRAHHPRPGRLFRAVQVIPARGLSRSALGRRLVSRLLRGRFIGPLAYRYSSLPLSVIAVKPA